MTFLARGAGLWVVFSAVAVWSIGPQWDECLEHAQVLAGQVAYPDGHPLAAYVRGAYSAQTRGAAWLLSLGADEGLLCGLRNFLFLLSTTLPVYVLGYILTRRPLWGHVAAALVLQGILLEFDGSYPAAVWPNLYSNGHIGGAWALLSLGLAVAGRTRAAAFFLGAMPAVHVGQFPFLAMWACGFAVWQWRGGGWAALRPAAPGLAAGLLCSAALALLQWSGSAAPAAPPESGAAVLDVWRGFTFHHDPHRRFPPLNGHLVLAGALLLSTLAAWRMPGVAARRRYGALAGYCLCVALAVWCAMMVQAALGEQTPFWLMVWMPYRVINHVPPILIGVLTGVLGRRAPGYLLLALIMALLMPVLAPWLGATLYVRYFAHGEYVVFLLYGAALAALLRMPSKSHAAPPRPAWAGCAVCAGLLTPFHQFGAACVGAGAVAALFPGLARWGGGLPGPRLQRAVIAGLAALLSLLALRHQARFLEPLPRGAFEVAARRVLEERGDPAAMVLAEPYSYMLQAKLRHPVLVEATTPSLISYLPALGPRIERMYSELYGIRFSLSSMRGPGAAADWQAMWQTRETREWTALGARHQFRYVVCPASLTLSLPLLLETEGKRLYAVPKPA